MSTTRRTPDRIAPAIPLVPTHPITRILPTTPQGPRRLVRTVIPGRCMITLLYTIARGIPRICWTVLATVAGDGSVVVGLKDAETFGNISETTTGKPSQNGVGIDDLDFFHQHVWLGGGGSGIWIDLWGEWAVGAGFFWFLILLYAM